MTGRTLAHYELLEKLGEWRHGRCLLFYLKHPEHET